MTIRWTDDACVLHITPLNEQDVMVELLTATYGKVRTVARRGAMAQARAIYQPTNLLMVHVQARDEHQLGHMEAEILTPYCAMLSPDRWRWLSAQAAIALVRKGLGERDAAPHVYALVMHYFDALTHHARDAHHALMLHSLMELHLLTYTGYGLDISRCAVTGSTHDLAYISPKTGRAVTKEVGAPYHDKLFAMPPHYLDAALNPTAQEVLDALAMNAYFLRTRLFEAHHGTLPEPRLRLEDSARAWLMPQPSEMQEYV